MMDAELDYRMLAYTLDQQFSGDFTEGKQFCGKLFQDDIEEVERTFQFITKYDRPVLDCVMHRLTNLPMKQRADLVAVLREEFPNLKNLQSSPLNIEDGQDEILRQKSKRIRIFEKISQGASEVWRSISHFLLNYEVIQTIRANHANDVKVRLQKVLEKWHESTDPEKGTWLHLKSLLIFLNKLNLVSEIHEDVINDAQSSQDWNDNLFGMFRNNVISLENEKKNRYSATVTATVPNEWSIIYSFIECLKERNKFFDKKNILEKITQEISDNLNYYEELGSVDYLLSDVEEYKLTGCHDSKQFKVILNALANTFHLCIKLLTMDETTHLYRLKDECHLVYPSRVQISTGVIEMCLTNEEYIQPLGNVKVETFVKKDKAIEIFQLKRNSCIFEAPSCVVQCCDTVILEEITTSSDGNRKSSRLVFDLTKVERETYDGYDYILMKDLDLKRSYRCILEYQGDDGVKYKLTSKEVSLKNSSIGNTLECYTPSHGCTVISHRNVSEIDDSENASPNFQSHLKCLQSESKAKNLSVSDWTDQCQNYLECNLLENNQKYFKDWIIFPNIFMDHSCNITKDVAMCIKEALTSHQMNEDPAGGVVVMYYNSQEHKKSLLKVKSEEEEREFSNRVLVFHQSMGAILNIRVTESTHPRDISNEFSECSQDVNDLDTVLNFLIAQGKITSPNITIATFVAAPNLPSDVLRKTLFNGKQTLVCDGCIPRVITRDQLDNVGKMKKWIETDLPAVLNNKTEKSGSREILKHVVAQISGFIANTSIEVAKHSDDIHEQLIHLQANDEQIQVIVDPRKHKVITAAFGCGKTVVATLQSEFLARMAKEPTTIFYISFDPFSLIDFYINKHLMDLNLPNVESGLVNLCITNVSEIAAEMGCTFIPHISQILNYVQVQQKKTGRQSHICFDELNTSVMSPEEVHSINEELRFMQESFVTLILQPFQYERFRVSRQLEVPVLVTHEKELDMAFLSLRKNMRNSMKISKLLEVAKDVINREETRYFYPSSLFQSTEENKPGSSSTVFETDESSSVEDPKLSDKTVTEESVNEGVANASRYLPVPMKPQESVLKKMSEIDVERSTEGISIRYRFDRSGGVGHSHEGETPKLMYIPSTEDIKKFNLGEYDQQQSKILRLAICMEYVNAGDTVICHDEEEFILMQYALNVADRDFITYAHFLENRNGIPSKDEKRNVSNAISEKSKIVITDSNGCRGFQIRKVVIPLSSTEQFHRHTILENAARATSDILFIVIDCSYLSWFGSKKSTFRKVIERLISLKIVTVIKPNIVDSSISRYANRLPQASVLQKTVSMIPTGYPTFEEIKRLIMSNEVSSFRRILTTDPSIVKMRVYQIGTRIVKWPTMIDWIFDTKISLIRTHSEFFRKRSFQEIDSSTLLMLASQYNKPSIVRMLLQYGADIGARRVVLNVGAFYGTVDHNGYTCLHDCARHNSLDCLSILLPFASPQLINLQDHSKRTALFVASVWGSLECIELLLKHNADPHIQDQWGRTAYDEACHCNGSEETKRRIKEVLLQRENMDRNQP